MPESIPHFVGGQLLAILFWTLMTALGAWAGRAHPYNPKNRFSLFFRITLYSAVGICVVLFLVIGVQLTHDLRFSDEDFEFYIWVLPAFGALGGMIVGFGWEVDKRFEGEEK